MKNFSKKKKVITLACSVVAVCVLSVGAMFATGVLPRQAKGAAYIYNSDTNGPCQNPSCRCHLNTGDSWSDDPWDDTIYCEAGCAACAGAHKN